MPRSYSGSRSPSPPKRRRSLSPDAELSPFLIRVFVTKGKHTPLIDFDDGKFPHREEFHVYGWKSSTPTSLIALLYPSFPAPYRSPMARFAFRHVYVDASQRGLYRSKDLVSFTGKELMNTISSTTTSNGSGNGNGNGDMEIDDDRRGGRKVEEKTLDDYGFICGDYISVSLHVPEPKVPQGQRAGPGRAPLGGLGREEGKRNTDGEWARGEALPAQGRGGGGRAFPLRGAPAPPPVMGMGIRGGARRSPSVGRDRDRDRAGASAARRSRSPERRRRDRSP